MLRRFTPAFPPTTPTCSLRALAHTQSFLAPQRRPLEFKVAFSPAEYAKLYKAMPDWDTDLAGLSKDTIVALLKDAGLPPLRAPKMANAMLKYIETMRGKPFGAAFEVAFDKWLGLPNGQTIANKTALPMAALRQRIRTAGPGIFWLESPPGSGKTALGNILEAKDGFEYVSREMGTPIRPSTAGLRFVDEAQRLNLREVSCLRSAVDNHKALIVCAGTSNAPNPTCLRCKRTSCYVCSKCLRYRCHHDGAKCPSPTFYSTISMLVAETGNRRLTVDNLTADSKEMAHFIHLLLLHGADRPRLSHEQARRIAPGMARALVDYTGGHLGWCIHLLRWMFEMTKCWKAKPVTVGDFVGRLHSPAALSAMKSAFAERQLNIDLAPSSRKALISWVRDGAVPDVRHAQLSLHQIDQLRKHGILRARDARQQQTWVPSDWRFVFPWAPLVFALLWAKFFSDPGHRHTPFSDLDSLVQHVARELSKAGLHQRLVDARGALTHEDEMNGAIAAIIKSALGKGWLHVGPALRKAKNKISAQADHLVTAPAGPLLLEVCKGQVQQHLNRLNGPYKQYGFARGGVLHVKAGAAATVGPKPKVPPKCCAYVYDFQGRRLYKYDPVAHQWKQLALGRDAP